MTQTPRSTAKRLAVIILNFRTPDLVIDCLASLDGQLFLDAHEAVVVDNASGDGSPDRISDAIRQRGWSSWVRVVHSGQNGGFAAGNNYGIQSIDADLYLLLNSDTVVREGAIESMLATMQAAEAIGVLGPRLEWPTAEPQISLFRYKTPLTELLAAAHTGPLDRWLVSHVTAVGVPDKRTDAQWVSFAAALIRHEVIQQVGLLDRGYFMYYEDMDYCRRVRDSGWRVVWTPHARVIHLRGGSGSVKADINARRRLPAYYYASRARYYAKFYGRPGLLTANLLWTAGRAIGLLRQIVQRRPRCTPQGAFLDNWRGSWRPLASHPGVRS